MTYPVSMGEAQRVAMRSEHDAGEGHAPQRGSGGVVLADIECPAEVFALARITRAFDHRDGAVEARNVAARLPRGTGRFDRELASLQAVVEGPDAGSGVRRRYGTGWLDRSSSRSPGTRQPGGRDDGRAGVTMMTRISVATSEDLRRSLWGRESRRITAGDGSVLDGEMGGQ